MTTPRRPKASPSGVRDGATRPTRQERKQQLLACARPLFATLGYQATTVEIIAQAAGLTVPALARLFPDKSILFLAIIDSIRSAVIEGCLETAHLADPLARLHAIAERYLDATSDHAVEVRLFNRALIECADDQVVTALRAFYQECESLLAEIIEEGQQTGVFRRSLNPRIGAGELIRAALGYSMTRPLGVPLYEEADHAARATECLLHCLLKTDV
jgi:AcrR family transcriptional regulator